MSPVHFVVIDQTGAILRTGSCIAEDAELQGDLVIVSASDFGVTGATHRFDLSTRQFVSLEV